MKTVKKKAYKPIIVFSSIFILWLILGFSSNEIYGGPIDDEYTHYFYARYSWDESWYLFDFWGRPGYTIIASPFAQFGFVGIRLLNSILALLTAILTYRIAVRLKIKRPVLAGVFCSFIPPLFLSCL
ncbi:MAG: hypothetical protein ABH879_05155 [archaeon]